MERRKPQSFPSRARSPGELASRGIRVNAVSPGPISTPLYDKLGLKARFEGRLTIKGMVS
jgi:NAD(P)-dependent dehydrogenase (short-subunit alcohol dehydrogenase family)